jgi:hypothetical protein
MNLFNLHHWPAAQAEMFRAFDSRPVSCHAVKRCLTPLGGEKMSCAKTVGHSLVVGPARVPLRWPVFETIVAIHEAFRESLNMRRAAYKEHRLSEE